MTSESTRSDDLDALRHAAASFVNLDEEEESDIEIGTALILTFGIPAMDSHAHRRAVWLCVLATRRILFGWSELGCEGDAPHQALNSVARWVQTGQFTGNWGSLCVPTIPTRNNSPVADCDACRVAPIASAAARTALFAKTANPVDGAIVLCDVRGAILEGLERTDSLDFNDWFVEIAIPEAYQLIGQDDD